MASDGPSRSWALTRSVWVLAALTPLYVAGLMYVAARYRRPAWALAAVAYSIPAVVVATAWLMAGQRGWMVPILIAAAACTLVHSVMIVRSVTAAQWRRRQRRLLGVADPAPLGAQPVVAPLEQGNEPAVTLWSRVRGFSSLVRPRATLRYLLASTVAYCFLSGVVTASLAGALRAGAEPSGSRATAIQLSSEIPDRAPDVELVPDGDNVTSPSAKGKSTKAGGFTFEVRRAWAPATVTTYAGQVRPEHTFLVLDLRVTQVGPASDPPRTRVYIVTADDRVFEPESELHAQEDLPWEELSHGATQVGRVVFDIPGRYLRQGVKFVPARSDDESWNATPTGRPVPIALEGELPLEKKPERSPPSAASVEVGDMRVSVDEAVLQEYVRGSRVASPKGAYLVVHTSVLNLGTTPEYPPVLSLVLADGLSEATAGPVTYTKLNPFDEIAGDVAYPAPDDLKPPVTLEIKAIRSQQRVRLTIREFSQATSK